MYGEYNSFTEAAKFLNSSLKKKQTISRCLKKTTEKQKKY